MTDKDGTESTLDSDTLMWAFRILDLVTRFKYELFFFITGNNALWNPPHLIYHHWVHLRERILAQNTLQSSSH